MGQWEPLRKLSPGGCHWPVSCHYFLAADNTSVSRVGCFKLVGTLIPTSCPQLRRERLPMGWGRYRDKS